MEAKVAAAGEGVGNGGEEFNEQQVAVEAG